LTSAIHGNSEGPRFSVVAAVYNVAPYLSDFLTSLESQTIAHEQLQIILVDDGSTDESPSIISSWQNNTSLQVQVITKENGGQASARNLGMAQATGEWVTFADPDDYLADNYFDCLTEAIDADVDHVATMFATHLITHNELTGEVGDTHALRRRFRDGNRIVDLDRSPDFFHMSAGTAVLNREFLLENDLWFKEELRFSFEDAHLISSYLLRQNKPTIGYVDSARYYYRKRASGDSSIQLGSLRPEKYTDVLKYGHIDLIRQAEQLLGQTPTWLQYLMLYDVLWYFRGDRRPGAPSSLLSPETLSQFHDLIAEVLQGISEESIHSFDVMATDRELRDALLLGYKEPSSRPSQVVVDRIDVERRATMLRYQFSGPQPSERVVVRGLAVRPIWCKTQAVVFFGRTLYSRRFLWIPATATFSVALDGHQMPLEIAKEHRPTYTLRPSKVSKALVGLDITARRPRKARPKSVTGRIRRRLLETFATQSKAVGLATGKIARKFRLSLQAEHRDIARVRRLLSRRATQRKYASAWILMDRVDRANDNAEHLYRYLQTDKPAINAWFVLTRDCPDWARLRAEGFRLLEYGSEEWKCALLLADHYISSHLDKFITNPLPSAYGKMRSKFTFLQHGVTKDDQSRWFNSKKIDLLVTASNDEYRSIVSDGSKYKFSEKEVKLTGFPRHDALIRQAGSLEKKSRIVIAPTWRSWLTGAVTLDGKRLKVDGFRESEYAVRWRELCSSPALLKAARENGQRISILPHPTLEQYLEDMGLPEHVEILSWDDMPFNRLLSTTSVWVTDYSSSAFDAAYANVPVVYFQFDRERVMSGGHIYQRGYYDYVEHGFGPVDVGVDGVVSAISRCQNGHADTKYDERRKLTFAYLDDQNSSRVFQEIVRLRTPEPFNAIVKKANIREDSFVSSGA
jgi:glycosyltransferase involved in cell wall biosynthesis